MPLCPPALPAWEALIEARIADAQRQGELDDLPGAGRPQDLEDDTWVPAELRMAYRLLKNAGVVPPEVHDLNEIGSLLARLRAGEAGEAPRLHALLLRLELAGRSHLAAQAWQDYDAALTGRFARS